MFLLLSPGLLVMQVVKCRNEITEMGSLFEGIPSELPEELFDTISSNDYVKIERIVSRGHASPEGFWYDQEHNEFVLVVKGSAGLKLENITATKAEMELPDADLKIGVAGKWQQFQKGFF